MTTTTATTEQNNLVNKCHNPAGCENKCRPGYNFCDACREFFGMKKSKAEATSIRQSPRGYRFPLMGVGPAGQTHLKQQESKAVTTETGKEKPIASDKPTQTTTPKAVCPDHGKHDGVMIGKNHCPEVCPECESNKKKDSLVRYGKAKPRTGVMFEGWLKDWIEAEAATKSLTVRQFVVGLIMDMVPADVFKRGVMADLQRKEPLS